MLSVRPPALDPRCVTTTDVSWPVGRKVPRARYTPELQNVARAALPVLPALFLLSVIVFPFKLQLAGFVLTSTRILALCCVIPLLFVLLSGRAGRIRTIDIGVFLYAVWSVTTILYWHGLAAIQFVGSNTLELLCGYLIARVCIRNVAQMTAVVGFFTLVILWTLPWATFESVTGRYLAIELFNKIPVVFGPQEWVSPPRLGLDRAQVLIENAIHYGVICSMVFSLAMVGMTGQWSPVRRIATMFGLFLCAFFSLSSGAFLAVLLQLGLIIWAAMFRANENRWIILMALAFTAFSIVEVLSDRDAITVFLSYATFSPASAMNRKLIFEHGMNNVWANPIMGIGLNDWERLPWMVGTSVDNFWLLTAMRHGFIGFGFLATAWLSVIMAVLRRKPQPDTAYFWMRRAWLFTMCGLTLSLATVHVWGSVYATVLFFMAMGVALVDDDADTAAVSHASTGPAYRNGRLRRGAAEPSRVRDASDDPVPPRTQAGTNRYTRFPRRSPQERNQSKP